MIMKNCGLDGLQRIATGFPCPEPYIMIFFFLSKFGGQGILTRDFLFFIHSVDRDFGDGCYQPYGININISEESCPATGFKRNKANK